MTPNLLLTCALLAIAWSLCLAAAGAPVATEVRAVERPEAGDNPHHIGNRAPLRPAALLRLPPGAVRAGGWLHRQLRLQADGFHGRLGELSPFLAKEGNAWLHPRGLGDHGWEEPPYWLKGYLNAAYALGDEAMLREAMVWIEGAIASQQEDGWFGPDGDRTGAATNLRGREDLWPNTIMLFCLMDHHAASGDPRVIDLMTRYFRYLEAIPEDRYLVGYWPRMRGGDLLHAILWLYNREGGEWLLELAAKTHRRTARWDEGLANWHNVNIAQGFRAGATWWLVSGDPDDLASADRNWREIRRLYGQVPGGMFGSDENCRPGFTDPRQAIETCGLVEEMLSHHLLLEVTGDPVWADRCEDVAFNMLPAAFTEDMRALRYLTAPNQPVSDSPSKAPGIQNGGPMYQMNPHIHRCCQHNGGHGWPYLAHHLWFATPDRGLAMLFPLEARVDTTVADGVRARVDVRTRYPFDDRVRLTVSPEREARFPLYLRIPGWCERPALRVNGEAIDAPRGDYLRVERLWRDGDTVELTLPRRLGLRRWDENRGSVSVDYGPLTMSLEIAERYERSGGTDAWPAFDILPESGWNLGLVLDGTDPAAGFTVAERPWPEDDRPWSPASVPLVVTATAREIPAWQLDRFGLAQTLQDSPVASPEPDREVRLIPMGAARLRISAFPVIGDGGTEWEAPRRPVRVYDARASHCYEYDSVQAVADGLEPASSDDHTIERLTFWPRRGTEEWVEASFPRRRVEGVSVYWFDDTGRGSCRVPASFRVLVRDGDRWVPAASPAGGPLDTSGALGRDRFNAVRIRPVETTGVRLEITLRPEFSAGLLELRVE